MKLCWFIGLMVIHIAAHSDTNIDLQSKQTVVEYTLTLSLGTLSPDCFQRSVILINGQFPGPTIRAPRNARLIVNVQNNLLQDGSTIHWHGFKNNRSSEMDGVAFGTQMPIGPGKMMRYDLNLTYNNPGTYWYHAHYQLQSQSVYGALIIDDDQMNETLPVDYDDERTLILADWYHQSDQDQMMGLMGSATKQYEHPKSILINGKGRYDCSLIPGAPCDIAACQYERIQVDAGKVYRFRIVAASSHSYFFLAIAGHNLTVFEVDGHIVQPFTVDHLEVNSGQRYSVLLKADQPPDNYRISTEVRWQNGRPTALAFLSYKGASAKAILNPALVPAANLTAVGSDSTGFPNGIPLFPPYQNNTPSSEPDWLTRKLVPWKSQGQIPQATRELVLEGKQDQTMAMPSMHMHHHPKWLINGHSYYPPKDMPLLYAAAQGKDFMTANLDSEGTLPLVFHLEKGDVIDIILQNTVALNGICEQHP